MRKGISAGRNARCSIINTGDLVFVGSVHDLAGNNQKTGIIIQYSYGFGCNDDEWLVLISGKISKVSGMYIWPVENFV